MTERASRKPTPRRPRQARVQLPPSFVAVAALLQEHDSPAELRRALAAAQREVRNLARDATRESPDALHAYIAHEAEHGLWGDEIRKILATGSELRSHMHNAYGGPALLVGAAFACYILTNHQS